ncbi:MAG TPA: tail fiber protein [Mycobacteriales bacterium]|jgi:microcystin-dependent protein|nr:tail fiber protein [Mycobacteriales bacterium]
MESYVGEIKMFCGTFAPVGWLKCDGSLLRIADYDVLFALIGINYGGDGITTFALPDLRGRVPIHRLKPSMPEGLTGGVESVTLTSATIAQHSHSFVASTALATDTGPPGGTPAQGTSAQLFVEDALDQQFNAAAVLPYLDGGNQPHENRHPFQAVNYIIAYEGIYPPHS